jgi:hypothetical protein
VIGSDSERRGLQVFRELGAALFDRWKRANFDESAFADLAAAALRDFRPSEHVEPSEVLRWVQDETTLPPQADIEAKFGQPPITVFHCERFYIDVLFWVDGTTAIHQHAFSGGFHVLDGSSLQCTYRFTPERRYSEHLLSGRVDLQSTEILTRGDVRTIRSGDGLVHSLFHLDRPSVSVVVRTPGASSQTIQYSYSRSGLAFDPTMKTESMSRAMQVLDLLATLRHGDFERTAREWVRNADVYLAFRLLKHVARHFERAEDYRQFVETIRPSHSELAGALIAFSHDEQRDHYIIARRQLVQAPDLRLFLAILLNLSDRSSVFDMVRRIQPHSEPPAAILGWLDEIARLDSIRGWALTTAKKALDPASQNILDVPWDDASKRILGAVLAGTDATSVAEADQAARARLVALRASMLLRPLLAP